MEALHRELLAMIVTICKITEQMPEDYDLDAPLIGPQSPLGIDSLDAVEIVFNIQKKYNVRIDSEETSRKVLISLRTLADFITRQQAGG